jgi:hypothetical protein
MCAPGSTPRCDAGWHGADALVSQNGYLLSRRVRSLPANASGFDTHRDSISSRCAGHVGAMAATRGPVELPGIVFPGHGRAQHTQGSVVGEVVESAALSGNLALRVRLRLGNLENTSVVRLDELREPTAAELAEYQAQRRRWAWCISGVQVRIAVGLPCLRRTLATDAASGVGRSAIVVSTDKEGFVRLRFSDGTEDVVKTTRLQHIADQQSDDAYALREEAQQWQGLVDTFHMGAYAKVDSTQRRGAIRIDKWEGQVCAPLTRLRVDRTALLCRCCSAPPMGDLTHQCARACMDGCGAGGHCGGRHLGGAGVFYLARQVERSRGEDAAQKERGRPETCAGGGGGGGGGGGAPRLCETFPWQIAAAAPRARCRRTASGPTPVT